MKKILQLLAIVAMMAGIGSAVAQAPQKMNYQAVIRNGNGELVATSDIGARVAIVNAANAEVYSETHQATTNENGLLVLSLGAGSPESGSFEAIDWSNGTYSVRVQIDITGGSNYTVASEQALMSVPYALLASKAQSVKYSDVTDKPTIPSSVSELTNDAGYITSDQVFMNGDQLHVGNTVVTISGNGFDGDYNSLTNKPTIPTAVSELTNDANYITIDDVEVTLEGTTLTVGNTSVELPAGFDGDYNSLTNKPDLSASISGDTLYVNGTALELPAGFDGDYNSLTNKPDLSASISGDTLYVNGNAIVLPEGFSGDYFDLTNRPNINDSVLISFFDIFRNDTLRDSVVDMILTDSLLKVTLERAFNICLSDKEMLQNYGGRLVDTVFSDTAMVMTLVNTMYNGLLSDTTKTQYYMAQMYHKLVADSNLVKHYAKYIFRQLQERSDLIESLFRRAINNATIRSYGRRVINYAIDNYGDTIINLVMSHISSSQITSIIESSGVLDTYRDQMMDEANHMVDSIKDAIRSQINDSIASLRDSMQTVIENALGGVEVTLTATAGTGSISGTVTTHLTSATEVLSYGVMISTVGDFMDPSATRYTGSDADSFTKTGLTTGDYFVRAYATTAKGVAYSEIKKVHVQ